MYRFPKEKRTDRCTADILESLPWGKILSYYLAWFRKYGVLCQILPHQCNLAVTFSLIVQRVPRSAEQRMNSAAAPTPDNATCYNLVCYLRNLIKPLTKMTQTAVRTYSKLADSFWDGHTSKLAPKSEIRQRISASLMVCTGELFKRMSDPWLNWVNVFVASEPRVLFRVRILTLTARGTNRTIIKIKMFLWHFAALVYLLYVFFNCKQQPHGSDQRIENILFPVFPLVFLGMWM